MLKSYEFPMCDCYIPICEWYYHHVFLGNQKNVQLNYHFIPRYISTIPVLKRTKIHSQFIMIMIALYQVYIYIYDLYIISCILIYSLCNRYISIYIYSHKKWLVYNGGWHNLEWTLKPVEGLRTTSGAVTGATHIL